MQSFLSTSADRAMALAFPEASAPPTAETSRIVFQFNIDTRLSNTKPYANIKGLSFFRNEEEVLISLGSIFRIEQMEYNQGEQTWIGILSLCSEDDYELKDLMKQMEKELSGGGIIALGHLMYRQGDYEKSRNYFQQLLLDPSTSDFDRAECYRGLRAVAVVVEEYDKAIEEYENSLKVWNERGDQQRIGKSHMAIGEVYYFQNKLDVALSYEQKALDILLLLNHPLVSDVYAVMAKIYMGKTEFDSAIEHYEKSLEIAHQHLPVNEPSFGVTYENIGTTYGNKGDHQRALEYYAKASAVYQVTLPPNHPFFSDLKNNIDAVKGMLNQN
ncbi:unnamed protein product [Didymodactylos carnosus]|uniref:Tetratricopeptide repeat protein n=1 Tax=Didymodactylos carnosus TaxID=1234261 RepID=A0A814LVB7_9BILA|nr:unnamed protein product [Didymodactylos carnosus]CAF1068866.1 unnamed protein product [Didymodactylos carnosus]CAF3798817.1 unnamed protein product [Didymodactylos carnosus]CAF3836225.1 unnamed protein product [Didymodactylos carnosus]